MKFPHRHSINLGAILAKGENSLLHISQNRKSILARLSFVQIASEFKCRLATNYGALTVA
jgi:hypothetical protein